MAMSMNERAATTTDVEWAARAGEGAVDEVRLWRWVDQLAVPRHIVANRDGNRAVGDRIAEAFAGYGLDVSVQGQFRNVVALPRGAGGGRGRRSVTLVAAHYDAVPDCPGADDNASALAVMLECARLLTPCVPDVGFVAFNAEEDGLLGSRDFVAALRTACPVPVEVVHVLEMVGFRNAGPAGADYQELPIPYTTKFGTEPDFLGVVGKSGSNRVVERVLASTAAPGLRVLGARTWGPLHWIVPDLMRSDHFPFWRAGIPAVLWTDTGNFRNPNYHRASDTPDTLDYGFMRDVGTLLCATVRGAVARR